MREIFYRYSTLGAYVTEDKTSFDEDSQLKITIEPHDFSLKIGEDTLRSTSLSGYSVVVSNDGEAVFYSAEGTELARVDGCDNTYKESRLCWKQGFISIEFGFVDVIDNYPNCDGESDRWDTRWTAQRTATLNTEDNSVEVK